MAPCQSRQLLLACSVSTLAVLLSLLWYGSKKRSRPGGPAAERVAPSASSSASDASSAAASPRPQPATCSLPIDIRQQAAPPIVLSDTDVDMHIENMRSLKSASRASAASTAVATTAVVVAATTTTTTTTTSNSGSSSSGGSLASSVASSLASAPPSPPERRPQQQSEPEAEPLTEMTTTMTTMTTSHETAPDVQPPPATPSDIVSSEASSASSSMAGDAVRLPEETAHIDGMGVGVADDDSSDSGKGGSELASTPPPSLIVHRFTVPDRHVGRLIGRHGAFVHQIKSRTDAHMFVRRNPNSDRSRTKDSTKLCVVEGTPAQVAEALALIRDRFPEKNFPELTLEHVQLVLPTLLPPPALSPECMHLKLIEGVNNDTTVSCVVAPDHLFLQQPTHPTFPSLNMLTACMDACYGTVDGPSPAVTLPVDRHTICVARCDVTGSWRRCSVVSSDPLLGVACVKYLDHGGYATVNEHSLRQIRGDFLLLPFQAAECVLANVRPAEGTCWSDRAHHLVADLTNAAVVFTQVLDYLDDGLPLVHVYVPCATSGHVLLLNRELVTRGHACWVD